MLSEGILLDLVGKIYDAAGDASLWPAFLEAFGDAVAGTSTTLVYHDMVALRGSIAASVRTDPQCEQMYNQYFGARDPWRSAWLKRFSAAGPASIVTSEQLIEPGQLQKTEFYNDFLVPNQIVHQFCGPIIVNKEWSAVLNCLRPAGEGSFGLEATELLRLLLPHLQRAIFFHRRFAELEGRQRRSAEALDLLSTGVIILDSRGRVLTLNRAAAEILNQKDGLSLDKDGLRASTSSATNKLRAIIAAACAGADNYIAQSGGMHVERPSGKRPFDLAVIRTSAHSFAPEVASAAGVVFVNDPEMKPATGTRILVQIYDLTEAEARVAEQLMRGETLVQAADRLGITHNTARTHLRRIYEKTNTHHQGELLRLLLAGAGRVNAKPKG